MKKTVFGVILGILLFGMFSISILAEDIDYDTSCGTDDDCMLINKELGFNCCWVGACESIDYSLEKYIAVNKNSFLESKDENCLPIEECGPAPGCPTRAINLNFKAKCINNECTKVAYGTACQEGYVWDEVQEKCVIISCPQYTPPAPGWCDDGEIVGGGIDENGCQHPPSCKRDGAGTTTCKVGCICKGDTMTCPVEDEGGTVGEGPGIVSCQKGCVCKGDVTICTKEGEKVDFEVTTPGWSEDEVSRYKDDEGPTQGQIGESSTGTITVPISMIKQGDTIKIKSGGVEAVTSGDVMVIDSKLTMKTSNGRNAEIKIMPETASETAISKLGELGFTIELKEVGKGDEAKVVYEAKAKKQGRFLGLFKIKGEVQIQIDSETGEVISVKKPWWSFLATGI